MVSKPDSYAEYQARERDQQHSQLDLAGKLLASSEQASVAATQRMKELEGQYRTLEFSLKTSVKIIEREEAKNDALRTENGSLQGRLTDAVEQFNEGERQNGALLGQLSGSIGKLNEVKVQRDGLLGICRLAERWFAACEAVPSDSEEEQEAFNIQASIHRGLERALAACKQEVQS